MTEIQKEEIRKMRQNQQSYTYIAKKTGLSIDTVKSFCRRNGMVTEKTKSFAPRCKHCGKVINSYSKSRPRLFCCDKCKQNWWNKNRHERESENLVSAECQTCGKPFTAYSGANRKYCSQACYRERNAHDGE